MGFSYSQQEKYEQQCHQSSKQMAELQTKISDYMQNEEKLIKYIRELEQKNDDLERSERVMLETVGDIEAKLNSAIERNALLENELDEKEMLKAMVQRLKDEQRDMQQEYSRQRWHSMPDNNKVIDRVKSPVDSNKLSSETQTPSTQMKIGSSVGQLSPPNRISAINLVGDLLRKVGLEKWLCPGCSRVKCNCGVYEALSPTSPVRSNTISQSLRTARS